MPRPARMSVRRLLVPVLVLLAAACGAVVTARQEPGKLGVDLATFDRSVRPQDDFNRFVNGTWIKNTEIPPDRSSWGSFPELSEKSDAALQQIIDSVTKTPQKPGSTAQQVADAYLAFMDTARIEALGIEPLGNELKSIAALTAPADLAGLFGRMARVGVAGPFAAFVGQDQKQSDTYIVAVNQGGLGMPDRDYYLRPDPKLDATRAAYLRYITTMLTLAKQPDPEGAAKRIMALETAIAEKHWDRARTRDRDATYNKMTVAELNALTPSFNWPAYLRAAGIEKATHVVVRQPDYLTALDGILRDTPLSTWKEALTFRVLTTYADELPEAFGLAQFEFRGKTLSGQQEMRARLEARRRRGGRSARRGAGQALRGAPLQARGQGAHGPAREESAGRIQAGHRRARVDGPRHQGPGPGQAGEVHGEDRLSRSRGATSRRLPSRRTTRSATPSVPSSSPTTTMSRGSASRSIARAGP